LSGHGEIAGDFDFLAHEDIDTAPEDDFGLDLGSHLTRDLFGKEGAAVRAEGLEAIEVQDEFAMPRRGSLGVGIQFDLFRLEACPARHVFNIPGMESPRREEALARFKVAATEQKAKLIGGRAQARGRLLDGLGEIKILLALETIEDRGRLEGFLLDSVEDVHSRHGRPPEKVVAGYKWPNERASGTEESTKSLGMLAQMLWVLARMNPA